MRKLFAASLMLLGSGFLLTGYSISAEADVVCNRQTHPAMVCVPAHEYAPEDPGGVGVFCQEEVILLIYYYCRDYTCSSFGGSWGLVVTGDCEPAIFNTSQPPQCIENVGTTEVTQHYYESQCGYKDGVCQCLALPSPYIENTQVVCNCQDEP